MTALPILTAVARALHKVNLDAVLIGNAAAALHGAPVTTIDLDFFIRKTPGNTRKLKALAGELRATIFRPYYPHSDWFRLSRDLDALQLDFIPSAHFAAIHARSEIHTLGETPLRIAAHPDIVMTPDSSGVTNEFTTRSPVVPPFTERTETRNRSAALRALRKESQRVLEECIRDLQSKPIEQRMNFLRKRIGLTATAL